MSASLARVIAVANKESNPVDSMGSFLVNLADEIRARLTDSVALTALCDEIEGAYDTISKSLTGSEPSVSPDEVERANPDVSHVATTDPDAANANTDAYTGGAFVMPSNGQKSEVPEDEAIPGDGERPTEPAESAEPVDPVQA